MSGLDPVMFELFREEVRAHAAALAAGLIDLETDPANPRRIEPLMRAAHSIKGAARIANIDAAVRLAHAAEDALVSAQDGRFTITAGHVDTFLKAVDLLAQLGQLDADGLAAWSDTNAATVATFEPRFAAMTSGEVLPPTPPPPPPPPAEVVIPVETVPLPPEHSMFDRFREELRANLLDVRRGPSAEAVVAAKQIRGAALLVKCEPVAAAAAALGDVLDAQRSGRLPPSSVAEVTNLLAGCVSTDDDSFPEWVESVRGPLAEFVRTAPRPAAVAPPPVAVTPAPPAPPPPPSEPVVRVTAKSLNRLMGLAGESLVQARWLQLFSTSLLKHKKQHDALAALLDSAYHAAATGRPAERVAQAVAEARVQAGVCRQELADKTTDFDDHAARAEDLNSRLYREVIVSRMRPFADGVHGLARLVRDMARSLGKHARLEVEGEETEVDRDVLEKLEAPLSHLVRNAVDHGVESPAARKAAGKPETAVIRVEARHRAGMLSVSVADDGGGVDLDRLRAKIVARGLSTPELVRQMTDAEVLEFLFLPGFTTADAVTEFSGRGVGLDVVQETARAVGGGVRVTTTVGVGTAFHLQLPITLSVMRAVVADIGGEPYAFAHNRIDRLLRVPRSEVRSVEHRQFVSVDGQRVGLVVAAQLLDLPPAPVGDTLPVVLLRDATGAYGLVVESFRGEQDLVVRPLDPRLGKVPNLSAAAILDDGTPVLIVDTEDMLRAMDHFIQSGSLQRCEPAAGGPARRKRVLVADDSITVREVERQLLRHKGYDVTVAVDGADAWNQVRAGRFDLLVTDVDMPRMNGLQLVKNVRADDKLKDLPVVIVSYKEREEDRLRGLDVGANHYLTKSAFHDNSFVQTVEDLIGPA